MTAKKLSRRKFLELISMEMPIGLFGKSFAKSGRKIFFKTEDYDLAVAKGGKFSSSFEASYNRIKVAVDVFGGMHSFVKGKKALIKVNAIDNSNQLGNTSSEALYAVIKLCKEAGAESVIVLSHDKGWTTLSKKHPSLKETIINQGAELFILTNDKQHYIKQSLDKGGWHKLYVAKILYDPDTVLINVPRAKTHPWTCYTMCIKNLMGLVRDMNHFHSGGGAVWPDFPFRMAAAYKYIFRKKVSLNILDCMLLVYGWHSPAPERMGTFNEDAVIVGPDALAIDAYGIEMFHRHNPKKFMAALGDWNTRGNFYANHNLSKGNYIKECYAIKAGKADISKLKINVIDLNT